MFRLFLIVAVLWSGVLAQPLLAEEPPPSTAVPLSDLFDRLAREPLSPHETLRITRLTEDLDMSALLVQVHGALPPHFHRRTREVFYLIRGEGMFRLGTDTFPIHSGSVVRVEPGQAHTFSSDSEAAAVFFVVTSPRWDESDRVPADGPAPGHK